MINMMIKFLEIYIVKFIILCYYLVVHKANVESLEDRQIFVSIYSAFWGPTGQDNKLRNGIKDNKTRVFSGSYNLNSESGRFCDAMPLTSGDVTCL